MANNNYDDFDDYFELLALVEEENNVQRLPKRYIRDAENPVEFYADDEFRRRYRFDKHMVTNTILPLIINGLQVPNNRGLPVSPLMKLLICLRFYATGNFQVR